MSKYIKLVIEPQKLLGLCLSSTMKGETKITINMTPPKDNKENSPDFVGDCVVCWVNESKFSDT